MKRQRKSFDLDALEAAVKAKREQTDIENAAARLRSEATEARLLAAIIGDVGVLERVDDLELEDFTDFRYRAAFKSIRNLQASGTEPTLLAVADDLAMDDLTYGKHVSESVSVYFLANLVVTECPYFGDEEFLAYDVQWLRTLAEKRRAL